MAMVRSRGARSQPGALARRCRSPRRRSPPTGPTQAATELEYRVELLNKWVAAWQQPPCRAAGPPPASVERAAGRSPHCTLRRALALRARRMVASCHEKCAAKPYKEGILSVGETSCIDRCAAKYWQVRPATPAGAAPGGGGCAHPRTARRAWQLTSITTNTAVAAACRRAHADRGDRGAAAGLGQVAARRGAARPSQRRRQPFRGVPGQGWPGTGRG